MGCIYTNSENFALTFSFNIFTAFYILDTYWRRQMYEIM